MNRDFLTIGEFASLLEISTHQVRYFEEKKILLPEYVDRNGYRLYGVDQIYKMLHILFLRELDIPVKSIGDLQHNDGKEKYVKVLSDKLSDIDEEIQRLIKMKDRIRGILEYAESKDDYYPSYTFKSLKRIPLKEVYHYPSNREITARDFIQLMSNYPMDIGDVIYEINDGATSSLCIESKNDNDIALLAGKYLVIDVMMESEKDIYNHAEKFFEYAENEKIVLVGPLILKQDIKHSIFRSNSVSLTMMSKVEEKNNG